MPARDLLRDNVLSQLDGVAVNGSLEHRLPGNLNLTFAGVAAEAIMMGLRGIALSSGSACTSASIEPSYVLGALGVAPEAAHGSIRFGIGRFNTEDEIRTAVSAVLERVRALRALRGIA